MDASTSQPTLSDGREADLAQYRAVSPLAVSALALGIASALALLHGILWTLPAAAIVCGALGLKATAGPHATVTGRKAAAWGIILGLFFGAWAPAAALSRGWMVRSQSREFTAAWLDLVQGGRLQYAHQFTLSPLDRQTQESSIIPYYEKDEQAQERLEKYFGQPPLERIAAAGGTSRIEFLRTEDHTVQKDTDYLVQLYRVHLEDAEDTQGPAVVALAMSVERSRHPFTRKIVWKIAEVSQWTGVID